MPNDVNLALERAFALRNELLLRLRAEPEWLVENEQSEGLTWCAGPAPTLFHVDFSEASSLAVLKVSSPIAYFDEIDAAKALVENKNMNASGFQWALISDWGAAGLTTLASESRLLASWVDNVVPALNTEFRPFVQLQSTFVIGEPTIELPLKVVELIVREQIATANAFVTWWEQDWGHFDPPVGEPIFGGGKSGTIRDSEWNDTLFHFDDHVTPFASNLEPSLVMQAIRDAHVRSIDRLESSGQAAWFGAGNEQWEVPFDEGPFTVVSSSAMPHLPHQATSFVQTHPWGGESLFPIFGAGVHVVMRLGDRSHVPLDNQQLSNLLNLQRYFPTRSSSPVSTHGIGAWAVMGGEVVWAMFIPAYWAETLTEIELAIFLDELLENSARLSWASRPALAVEGWADQPQPGGLAAGEKSRGETFGEPIISSL